MRKSRVGKILLYYIAPPLFFIIAFALVILIYNAHHQTPEVDITANGFMQPSVEITEGETIRFVNSSSSVTQVLCLGQNRVCDVHALDPATLKSPGLEIQPGHSANVVFENYGTYHITSPTIAGMNLDITVDSAG